MFKGRNRRDMGGSHMCLSSRFSSDMSDETVKCFISALKTKARVSARCIISSLQGTSGR